MKTILLVLVLLMSACNKEVAPEVLVPIEVLEPVEEDVFEIPVLELEEPTRNNEAVASHKDDRFLIQLFVSKNIYHTYEPLITYITLEYIGDEDSIVVSSSFPYWGLNIGTEDLNVMVGFQLPKLVSYTFIKGIVYTHTLSDALAFSVIDDYSMIEKIYVSKGVVGNASSGPFEGQIVQNVLRSTKIQLVPGEYKIWFIVNFASSYVVHLKYDIVVRD